jgi:hypothetical protein
MFRWVALDVLDWFLVKHAVVYLLAFLMRRI